MEPLYQEHFFAEYNSITGATHWSLSDGREGSNPGKANLTRRAALKVFLLFADTIDQEATFEFHETRV